MTIEFKENMNVKGFRLKDKVVNVLRLKYIIENELKPQHARK